MISRTIRFLALVGILVAFGQTSAQADASKLEDPCAALVHALKEQHTDAREIDFRGHVIACDRDEDGVMRPDPTNDCQTLAYLEGVDWMRHGYDILLLTPEIVGKDIDERAHELDCALEEDLTWD